jgi:UDPglucose 6-dehydrogenase
MIGIGRLGLSFALVCESKGYEVLGMDILPSYVDSLNNKTFTSPEPEIETMLKASKHFKATTSLKEVAEFSNIIFILVDTPSSVDQHYDHSKLGSVLIKLAELNVQNKHIVIGCTIMPGYVAHVGRFLIKECKNCTLSYNPQFIAQGEIVHGQLYPDIVLIGEGSKEAGDYLESFYKNIVMSRAAYCRMSPESAEICKLGLNCFITMKIVYANLIGSIADKTLNADKLAILSAIGKDSRVGERYLKPGNGFGGPCFPRDNRALGTHAKKFNIKPVLFDATDECNKLHTLMQANELIRETNDFIIHTKADSRTHVTIFESVGYKAGKVPIIEESQRLIIARALAESGHRVRIRDYKGIITEVQKLHGNLFEYEVIPE